MAGIQVLQAAVGKWFSRWIQNNSTAWLFVDGFDSDAIKL